MTGLTPIDIRFAGKFLRGGAYECWPWTAGFDDKGYGVISIGGKKGRSYRAHVVSMFIFKKYPLDTTKRGSGLHWDHLCRNTACVNPNHLELATVKENTLRGNGCFAINYGKTHCINGHEFTKENTIIRNRRNNLARECRECGKIRTRSWYHRVKSANRTVTI